MGKVSATQIKQWKEVHGKINHMRLKEIKEDKDGNPETIFHDFYFRDIKMQDLEIMALKDSAIAKKIELFNQCILHADDAIKDNEQMMYSAASYIDSTFKTYECELVKE